MWNVQLFIGRCRDYRMLLYPIVILRSVRYQNYGTSSHDFLGLIGSLLHCYFRPIFNILKASREYQSMKPLLQELMRECSIYLLQICS